MLKPDIEEPEFIEKALVLAPDFPYMGLLAVAGILEAEDIFVPAYRPPPIGLYHPNGFLYASDFEQINTILLPDRNIVSRMVRIVDGIPTDEIHRTVSALKAFCHFLDIQIEPSIAFHELAYSQGNVVANHELARFRDADNADPYPWLDFALGNLDALDYVEPQRLPESHDLALPLIRWRRNYVVALKIAELELSGCQNLDRMLELLAWMCDDFAIGGPAALLACIYFAPMSAPRKRLFKQLRSANRQRAIDGVRNAAWDLTHMSEMMLKANEANDRPVRILFASFDAGLRTLARLLFPISDEKPQRELLLGALGLWWKKDQAERIVITLDKLYTSLDDEGRKLRQANSTVSISEMIHRGEQKLLSVTGVWD